MSHQRFAVALAVVCLSLTACENPLEPVPAEGNSDPSDVIQSPSFATTGVIGVDVGFVYTAIDLGNLGSGPFHAATSINNRGHITGLSEGADGQPHAFYWSQATGIQGIASGQGVGSESRDISTNDNVAGTIRNADGSEDAFIWSPAGGLQVVGRFGKASARGMGVNDAGSLVGYFLDDNPLSPSFGFQSYLYQADGTFTELPPVPKSFPLSPFNTALDINNVDEVVGLTLVDPSLGDASPVESYYWSPGNGGSTSLGSLGANYVNHSIWSINDAGEVAGAASGVDLTTGQPIVTPFIWTKAGGFRNLRDEGFPAELFGSAVEANSLGYVAVSVVDPDTGIRTPAMWVPQYGLVLLPTLGGENGEVFSVNDLGQAVGWSQNEVGDTIATLWDLTFPPADAVSGQIGAIDQIIAGESNPDVAEQLNHAAIWLENAQDELAEDSPDLGRVIELMGRSIDEIQKAMKDGFDPVLGQQLIDQQVEAARAWAQQAIDEAGSNVGPFRLWLANASLATGDKMRDRGRADRAIKYYQAAANLAAREARWNWGHHHREDDQDRHGCPVVGRHHAHSYVWGHGWSWWNGQGWAGAKAHRNDWRWGWWKKGRGRWGG